MSLAGHDQRRRTARNRLVLAAVAAAAVVAGGVTAATVGFGSGESSKDSASHSTPDATPSSTGTATSSTGTSGVPGVTVLPKPRRVVGGVPVGYPHTTLGAVSAAAHYTDIADVFSPAVAEQQAKVFAEPGYTRLISRSALYTAQKTRMGLGLPVNGESDTGTYSVNQTRAYQTGQATADRVLVWLLVHISQSVHGVSTTVDQVDGAIVVWKGGDWKLSVDTVVYGMPKAHPPVATPDSADAVSKGWRAIGYQK
jgi:hypothetical protein